MRRYWIPQEQIQDSTVRFDGDIFHHIIDVCRQQVGHQFEVLTGDQKASLVELITVEKKRATGKILSTRELPPLRKPHLVLALSVPKFPVFDAVVEKSVELGILEIRPFFSEFSFVRKKDSWPHAKNERAQKIVLSATQQSGRGELMKVHTPVPMPELLKTFNQKSNSWGLFAYEGKAVQSLQAAVQERRQNPPDEVWLFVGSEGGFSQTEVQEFQQHGLLSTTLGDQVLRVETACITLAAILKYEFGLMSLQE